MDDFKLDKEDIGFKLTKDWSLEVAIPNFTDDETVPDYVTFVIAIMILIKQRDEEFFNFVWNKWEEYTNKAEKEECTQ